MISGLDKHGLKGLSIVILQALTPNLQIVKEICRQIDKPYMPISPYHGLEGLSNLKYSREYRRHTNIPIGRYTLDKRFEGLKV